MNVNKIRDNTVITPSGCWEWSKSYSSNGYGQLREDGVYWSAHVYSWVAHNRPLNQKEVVRHLCHNRKCCNPEHLLNGSHSDNYRDSLEVRRKASSKRRKSWEIAGGHL